MPEGITSLYEARQPLLEQVKHALEIETREALSGVDHIDRVSFRVKSARSFAAKACDPRNRTVYADPFVEIEDQVAGRVLVFFWSDIESVLSRLKETFNEVERTYTRPERDAEFGYESFHLICTIPPQSRPDAWNKREDLPATFELQVRTIFMHAYAEPQHDIGYKGAAELPRDVRRELAWIAASAWGADQAYERVRVWHEGRVLDVGPTADAAPSCK